ncbi:MAG: hypothetical protein ACOC2R_05040 [Spirochaetota bacterium]
MYKLKTQSVFFMLFFCLSLAALPADTVMLFSEVPTGSGNKQDSVIYVEDGIMEVFFSAGHIIFNGGFLEYDDQESEDAAKETFGDTPSFREAKSGGAGYILQVQLKFTEDEEEILPQKALYSFFELNSEKKLADGVVLLSEAGDREELEDKELIRRMGRQVGSQALQEM